jgi:hypothetical protein
MASIHEFLDELSINVELEQQYDADSRKAMTAWGLSEGQQQVILEGDSRKIRKEIQMESGSTRAFVIRMGSPDA